MWDFLSFVWTIGLTVEINLCLQILPALCGRGQTGSLFASLISRKTCFKKTREQAATNQSKMLIHRLIRSETRDLGFPALSAYDAVFLRIPIGLLD